MKAKHMWGDVNPLMHGGAVMTPDGALYHFESGEDWWTVYHLTDNADTMTPEDMRSDLDWVDWDGVCSSFDITELEVLAIALDPSRCLYLYELAGGYHGFGELDPCAVEYQIEDLLDMALGLESGTL